MQQLDNLIEKGYFHNEINGQKKTNQLLSLLTVMMFIECCGH